LTKTVRSAVVAIVIVGLVLAWRNWSSNDERAIRHRLDALTADVNSTASEGLATVVRAADISSYFTEDVVVDLGEGAAPIVGRATLVGMAARLQRRTAAFSLRFDDIGVTFGADRTTADVALTASFVSRDGKAGDQSMDAREFALAMTKRSGEWRIARVSAVDTLR
jgi:SnoaL-like domain